MCSGSEKAKSNSSTSQETADPSTVKDTKEVSGEMGDFVLNLLGLAANNDVESLKKSLGTDMLQADCAGLWYTRNKDSKKIVEEERTLLMVAASYGSVDVIKFLVTLPEVDLNRSCGKVKWTALHCAASGGTVHAFDIVKLLLSAGSDPCIRDANGQRPVDVIVVPPKLPGARTALEDLLMGSFSDGSVDECKLRVSLSSNSASSPALSSSPETRSPCSPSEFMSSPMVAKSGAASGNSLSDKKQYPVDPSFPDIRDGLYSSDEFRMYSFKVRPCSRAYSHDWTECPFAHPGENARRRDPRKFHYSCVPCPEFRKGACRHGDMCEYAHGVFECWLHPAQYRTRLCKDGTSCARQVCFFAHTREELRPLYVSSGYGVPSPRSAASGPSFMDMASAMNLLTGSPTSQSVMSPVFNQAMSPTAVGMPHSTAPWPQANVPTLYLPGSNLQSSRLRSSLNARDIPPEDLCVLPDYDSQQFSYTDMDRFSQSRPNSTLSFGQPKTALTPSNLEELFSADVALSPRFSDQAASFGAFSPTRKSAVLNQMHPQQSMLSPINTSNVFSQRNIEHSLLQASFGVSSPRMSSPRSAEPASPVATRLAAIAQQEKQQLQIRSLSSRDLGTNRAFMVGSPTAWSNFSSPNGKFDLPAATDNINQVHLKSSSSFELKTDGEEPDLSWVQSLVKESPPEMMHKTTATNVSGTAPVSTGECPKPTPRLDPNDHSVLGAWLEQMQLDQLTA